MSRAVAPSTSSRGPKASAATSSGGSPVRQGYLRKGLKCRYESGTYGWMSAVVQGFNESDCTYNLDVRDHADLDRIRARVSDKPIDVDDAPSRRGTAANLYSTESGAVMKRNSEARLGGGAQHRESSKASGAPRGSDLEAGMHTGTPTSGSGQKVGRGDRCTAPEHGLVVIESVSDGTFNVRTLSGQRLQFPAHSLRAPEERQYAWQAGTKVSYQSASLKGKWIDANVVSFNPANGTYNLDVRMEAAPDKVRPR